MCLILISILIIFTTSLFKFSYLKHDTSKISNKTSHTPKLKTDAKKKSSREQNVIFMPNDQVTTNHKVEEDRRSKTKQRETEIQPPTYCRLSVQKPAIAQRHTRSKTINQD